MSTSPAFNELDPHLCAAFVPGLLGSLCFWAVPACPSAELGLGLPPWCALSPFGWCVCTPGWNQRGSGSAGTEGLPGPLCHLRKVSVLAVAPAELCPATALFLVSRGSRESSELPSEAGHSALLSWCHVCAWKVCCPGITRNKGWFGCVVMFFPKHRQDDHGKADDFSMLGVCAGFKLWSGMLLVRWGRPQPAGPGVFCHLCICKEMLLSFACLSFTHSPYFVLQPPPAAPGTLCVTSGIQNLMKSVGHLH